MANIFEPSDPIGTFIPSETEFQVNVEPVTDLGELKVIDEASDKAERSFLLPLAIFTLLLFFLTTRLVNLQITRGTIFQVLAKGNRVETKLVVPPRGVILDRNGKTLAKNIPVYVLNVYPAQLPKTRADRETLYEAVSQIVGIEKEEIVRQLDEGGLRSLEPVTLKTNIDRDTALLWQVQLGPLSGVSINQIPIRSYELGLSHILGYVGMVTDKDLQTRPDIRSSSLVGKTGIEAVYDSYLQGQEGREEVEVDSVGQIQRIVSNEPALPGNSLQLYLDKDLQEVMANALREGLQKANKTKGVTLALDPRTGGVLGMVSLPSYDNNLFIERGKNTERQAIFDNQDQPLFNRAIAGNYPPGSTIKPLWSIAGLTEKNITESTDIITPAEITIGNSVFPDWKAHGHANVKKAIAESNNIFFYALAGGYDKIKGLGPNKLKDYANRFGLGQETRIDLIGEGTGLVPDPEWKKKKKKSAWYTGDSYNMAIGQGDLLVTPIQMAQAIGAIANGGKLLSPRVVKEISNHADQPIQSLDPPNINKEVAEVDILRIVREGMRQTVTEGTARPLADIPMPIAGKTGTAQFEVKGQTHAWFVGFAPYDNPSIVLVVLIEGAGDSFEHAVPIAKKIFSWYSEHSQSFQ